MEIWYTLLQTAMLLGAAALLGSLFERARMSALSGYVLAGALLGPKALNLFSTSDALTLMAELGVALLLFTIGLEFSASKLAKLGSTALIGGTLQIVITAAAVFGAALALGMPQEIAMAVGIIVAPSSTAVALRVLRDDQELDSDFGRNTLGILLFQDVSLVPLVLMITALGLGGTPLEVATGFGKSLLVASGMVFGFWVIIRFVLPVFFKASSGNRDLFILIGITTLLLSVWTAHEFGVSPALGAFAAGMLLAESPLAMQMRADMSGLRAIFVTFFFASVGMLADFAWIARNWLEVLGLVGALMLGKAIIVILIALLLRKPLRTALAMGLGLSMIGEFSFMLLDVGSNTGAVTSGVLPWLISATIVSLFVSPYLVKFAAPVGRKIERWVQRSSDKGVEMSGESERKGPWAAIIGLGPSGIAAAECLLESSLPVHAIDLNPSLVKRAQARGITAEVGDATHPEVIEHARLPEATAILITIPDVAAATRIATLIRGSCPNVPLIARSRWSRYREDLMRAGAEITLDEEEVVGRTLGTTAREMFE